MYPCKVPLETVDIELGLLGVHIGTDGEKVLKQKQKRKSEKKVTFLKAQAVQCFLIVF